MRTLFLLLKHFLEPGGWIMTGNFTISGESNLADASTVASPSISATMAAIKNGQSSVLTMSQLQELRSEKHFTEYRIKCYKPSTGRNLHLVLFKENLINGLLNSSPPVTVLNKGEYYRALGDDESLIGSASASPCTDFSNFYDHILYVYNKVHVQIATVSRLECDDYNNPAFPSFRNTGHWEFYVR